ncbi:TVP38/TMEM64 family protein [Patescibacteria group bacterium]|nr:TVP38/TMEM64 family protein [Patescibacteria group bacterium]
MQNINIGLRKNYATILFFTFIALALLSLFLNEPIYYLEQFIGDNYIISSITFIVLMFVATVIAPIAVLPIVPTVALVLGPLPTAMYSIVGWTAGAVVAFLIARHLGRPALARFVSLDEISKYEKYIPLNAEFWWIVILRMIIPVDILSYAIGFLSRISVGKYILATLIGVTPFSFVFAYLGIAFIQKQYFLLVLFLVIALFIFSLAYILIIKRK